VKAVIYTAPNQFAVSTVATPTPLPGEVLIRIGIAGMCGTDLHIADGGFFSAYPLTPGHEIVGRVESIGDGVTGLLVGQQVVVDNTVYCGRCDPCRRGEELFCRNFYAHGVNCSGGFAEYMIVQAEKCFDADDLNSRVAVMTEPLACAIHGMDVLSVKSGVDVLCFGAGPTGLLLAQLLVHGGAARVTVAAPTDFKLLLASDFGVDVTVKIDREDASAAVKVLRDQAPEGYDVVIEATGAASVAELCVPLTRDGGTVLIYGMADQDVTVPLRPYEVFRRELTIKGSFAQTHCFDRALTMLRSGRVRTDGILTHEYSLDDFGLAIECLRKDHSCLKAGIVP